MSYLIEAIKDRMHRQNKNWLAVLCGPTGSGKSYAAISLAQAIDPDFSVKDNMVFTPKQFMECLNSGKLKRGSAIVFDEAGVGIPSREWYSISNKLLSYIMQTFRTDNLAVIFTVPSFDFVDVNLRKLFHAYIETISIDFRRRRTRLKYKELLFRPDMGKVYYQFPRIPDGLGGYEVLTFIYTKKPGAKVCNEYDRLRDMYSTQLKTETEEKLDAKEERNPLEPCIKCKRRSFRWTKVRGMVCQICGTAQAPPPKQDSDF